MNRQQKFKAKELRDKQAANDPAPTAPPIPPPRPLRDPRECWNVIVYSAKNTPAETRVFDVRDFFKEGDATRKSPGKPATLTIRIADEIAAALNGKREDAAVSVFLVVVPQSAEKRDAPLIVKPGDFRVGRP